MPGFGPAQPALVVIAEAPARVEDTWCRECQRPRASACAATGHAIGQPLVGESGQLLRQALQEAGVDPEQVFFTNVVRCGTKESGNPNMLQVRKCRPYLLDELQALDYSKCRGVLVLGETAVRGVLNNGRLGIREARLRVLDHQGGPSLPVPVRATYHPAAALSGRNPGLYPEIVDDIRTAWEARQPVAPIEWVKDSEALAQCFPTPPSVLGLDLEWRPSTGELRLAGLSDGQRKVICKDPKVVVEWISTWCSSV